MTSEEIRTVDALQRSGFGYKRIASLTGINTETVKSHCRRHKVSPVQGPSAEDASFCRQCGTPITILPNCKRKQFCSNDCRMKWWAEHSDLLDRKAYYSFVCEQCGQPFESYGNDKRKYCSRACAAAARRTLSSYSLIYEMCGVEFESLNRKQRFCGRRCAQAAQRGEPLKYGKAKTQQAPYQGCETGQSRPKPFPFSRAYDGVDTGRAGLSDLPASCRCAECAWFVNGKRRCQGASNPLPALQAGDLKPDTSTSQEQS